MAKRSTKRNQANTQAEPNTPAEQTQEVVTERTTEVNCSQPSVFEDANDYLQKLKEGVSPMLADPLSVVRLAGAFIRLQGAISLYGFGALRFLEKVCNDFENDATVMFSLTAPEGEHGKISVRLFGIPAMLVAVYLFYSKWDTENLTEAEKLEKEGATPYTLVALGDHAELVNQIVGVDVTSGGDEKPFVTVLTTAEVSETDKQRTSAVVDAIAEALEDAVSQIYQNLKPIAVAERRTVN